LSDQVVDPNAKSADPAGEVILDAERRMAEPLPGNSFNVGSAGSVNAAIDAMETDAVKRLARLLGEPMKTWGWGFGDQKRATEQARFLISRRAEVIQLLQEAKP
jgi:hypothetical protein